MSRAPQGASARVRSIRPLPGVRWTSLVRRSFYWGALMTDDFEVPAREANSCAPIKLLSEQEWQAVIAALKLSPRHAAIIGLILQGKRDKQIAADLGMSIWTLRTHLGRLFQRLGVADRLELALHVLAVPRARPFN